MCACTGFMRLTADRGEKHLDYVSDTCFDIVKTRLFLLLARNITTDSLLYLNSRQALADVAGFIDFFRLRYDINATSKLVTFGGFYGGKSSLQLLFRGGTWLSKHQFHQLLQRGSYMRAHVFFIC